MNSEMGWSVSDRITVRGYDLPSEILGKVNLGDMAFLEIMGRLPTEGESAVFNAVTVTLVEHGVTPSALAARLTYMGAPEALQGAIAAGILGVGTVFVGTVEGAGRMLKDSIGDAETEDELAAIASRVVTSARERGEKIFGLGHPVHKPIDPRTERLFEIAAEHGFHGRYVRLIELIVAEARSQSGKALPLNATGAIGALLCELDFPIEVARGLGVAARAIGLIGHLREEMENPIAQEIWFRTEDEIVEQHQANAHAGSDLSQSDKI
jgi:citrate synthase